MKKLRSIAISPNSEVITLAFGDGSIKFFDIKDQKDNVKDQKEKDMPSLKEKDIPFLKEKETLSLKNVHNGKYFCCFICLKTLGLYRIERYDSFKRRQIYGNRSL